MDIITIHAQHHALDSDIDDGITKFLKDRGIMHVIAFSGGADTALEGVKDPSLIRRYEDVLEDTQKAIIVAALGKFRGMNIAILTGGTKWGVPRIASCAAKEMGLTTIGVQPEAGVKHSLEEDVLDLRVIVKSSFGPSAWGDESPVFAKLLRGVIVYAGGAGTLIEVAHILKINEKRISTGKQPRFIVPISGSGGVADGLHHIWAKGNVRDTSLPDRLIYSGEDAADALIDKLSLFDVFEQ